LQGKATLWWEEIKIVKEINEQEVTWEQFQKHFKDKYLTKRFYDNKAKEFHDLRLGLNLQKYNKARSEICLSFFSYFN